MVHSFKIDDCRIAADVNSGAVHVVEEIVFDILRLIDKKPEEKCPDSVVDALGGKYPKPDIYDAASEIISLCNEGLLFRMTGTAILQARYIKNPL